MQTCELGNTGLRSSVLGFGCSAIMGRTGRKESLRALSAAWDAGITFYDTARSYGYGESEAVLGEFLRGRRDRAIVSTKFGILARPQPLWKRAAKPMARALIGAVPSARAAIRRQAAAEFSRNHFDVSILDKSLTESLRKLKTDYVDLLFLHEATESVLEQEELILALEKLLSSGKVRSVGISAAPAVVVTALQRRTGPVTAAQFPCNVFDLAASGAAAAVQRGGWAGIANQPFGGVFGVQKCRSVLSEFAATAPAELRARLGEMNDAILADVALNLVLGTPGIHMVLAAMMKPEHIRDNVNAVLRSRLGTAELDLLRAALSPRLFAA